MKDDKKKLCEAGRGCPYKHPWAQVAASSSLPPASEPGAVEAGADMEACKYTPYYLIKDRRATFYPSKKMRSKVWHVITTFTYHYVLHPRHIWDSTLGYPGEGTFPYPYSYHYTIYTLNKSGTLPSATLGKAPPFPTPIITQFILSKSGTLHSDTRGRAIPPSLLLK